MKKLLLILAASVCIGFLCTVETGCEEQETTLQVVSDTTVSKILNTLEKGEEIHISCRWDNGVVRLGNIDYGGSTNMVSLPDNVSEVYIYCDYPYIGLYDIRIGAFDIRQHEHNVCVFETLYASYFSDY